MNVKIKSEEMRKFLNHVYDLHLQKGKITGLSNLYGTYGVSRYTGMSLQRTQVIEKFPGKRGVYKWISTARPNNVMIARTMKENTIVGGEYIIGIGNANQFKKQPKSDSKIVSLSVIKKEAAVEAQSKLIKAANIASIFKLNLFDMPDEKINELTDVVDIIKDIIKD